MIIPNLSLRTASLFILISLAHVASLLSLNFYTPKPESKIVDTDHLQLQENNDVAFPLNLRLDENSSLPLSKKIAKLRKR